jgi:hypothetical protein
MRKTTRNLSQYNRSPGRDLNMEPPEYVAGVLTTRQRRIVVVNFCLNKKRPPSFGLFGLFLNTKQPPTFWFFLNPEARKTHSHHLENHKYQTSFIIYFIEIRRWTTSHTISILYSHVTNNNNNNNNSLYKLNLKHWTCRKILRKFECYSSARLNVSVYSWYYSLLTQLKTLTQSLIGTKMWSFQLVYVTPR